MEAVNFLFKKGHRVIGMINGPEKLPASIDRLDGYIKALKKHRLKYDPNLIISSDLTKEGIEEAMKNLLSQRRKPTAIVVFNDYVVLDAIQYARKMKLRINKDITFVSYANLPLSHYTAYPPLASVEQFPYVQGQKATETLMEVLDRKKDEQESNTYYRIILESQLIVNEK
jgi:LacI family transcriptional regulator